MADKKPHKREAFSLSSVPQIGEGGGGKHLGKHLGKPKFDVPGKASKPGKHQAQLTIPDPRKDKKKEKKEKKRKKREAKQDRSKLSSNSVKVDAPKPVKPTKQKAAKQKVNKQKPTKQKPKARTSDSKEPVQVPVRGIAVVLGLLCTLMLIGAIGIVVLAHTSAFTITSIDTEATEHVSSADIASLAGVEEGTTLLNYDESLISNNLKRNPWIKDVEIVRIFPDRLKIVVTERVVSAYVMMNSGSVTWCLGDDNVWVEPVKVEVTQGQSMAEAALAMAVERGSLLVTNVPQTVNPMAGQPAGDPVFDAMRSYQEELSSDLWSQVVSADLSSIDGISVMLKSGLEISLGAPTAIDAKQKIIDQLLEKYPNRLTYINVRVPSNPTYRMVDTEAVEQGTGAIGDILDMSTISSQEAEAASEQPSATADEQAQSTASDTASANEGGTSSDSQSLPNEDGSGSSDASDSGYSNGDSVAQNDASTDAFSSDAE